MECSKPVTRRVGDLSSVTGSANEGLVSMREYLDPVLIDQP